MAGRINFKFTSGDQLFFDVVNRLLAFWHYVETDNLVAVKGRMDDWDNSIRPEIANAVLRDSTNRDKALAVLDQMFARFKQDDLTLDDQDVQTVIALLDSYETPNVFYRVPTAGQGV